MKNMKKISCLMLALVMALCMGISSFALATPEKVATEAGKEVTIEFTYEKIMGVNGTFSFSNPDMISDVKVVLAEGTNFSGSFGKDSYVAWYYAGSVSDCTIVMTVTIANDAKPGDECVVNFNYETTTDGEWAETPTYSDDSCLLYIPEEEADLDYTALKKTIKTAEGLTEKAYTAESWAAMVAVLKDAKALVDNADTQAEIDDMTAKLQAAIDALEPIVPDTSDMIVLSVAALAVAMAGAFVFFNKRRVTVK